MILRCFTVVEKVALCVGNGPWNGWLRPHGADRWGRLGFPGRCPGIESFAPLGLWGGGMGAFRNPGLRPGLECRAPSGLVRLLGPWGPIGGCLVFPGRCPGIESFAPLGLWGGGMGAFRNPGLRPGLECLAPSGLVRLLGPLGPMGGALGSQDGALGSNPTPLWGYGVGAWGHSGTQGCALGHRAPIQEPSPEGAKDSSSPQSPGFPNRHPPTTRPHREAPHSAPGPQARLFHAGNPRPGPPWALGFAALTPTYELLAASRPLQAGTAQAASALAGLVWDTVSRPSSTSTRIVAPSRMSPAIRARPMRVSNSLCNSRLSGRAP